MNKDPLLISIIIPVFNQWQFTQHCLKSLREHTPGSQFEILVVDNGSSDETSTDCQKLGCSLFPERFSHIRLPENLGFGPACNQGAEAASGRRLLFLNNDTLVTKDWLPPLVSALDEDQGLGAVGPLLLFPATNRVQHLGVAFVPGCQAHHLYSNFPAGHRLVYKKRDIKALTAAAVLMDSVLFRDCGGFHHGYLNGFEDVDLCCEIRKKGKHLRCIPHSVVYHFTSQTSGRFDQEGHNFELLCNRRGEELRPDLHQWYLDDGYDVRLTPCLRIYPTLKAEQSVALQRNALGKKPTDWYAMLEKEPLWLKGYDLLATELEQGGHMVEALALRHLQGILLPTLEVLQKELHSARLAKDEKFLSLTLARIHEIEDRLSRPDILRRKAIAIRERAKKWGDRDLERIYNEWLKKDPSQP